jgi:hypothetical protein
MKGCTTQPLSVCAENFPVIPLPSFAVTTPIITILLLLLPLLLDQQSSRHPILSPSQALLPLGQRKKKVKPAWQTITMRQITKYNDIRAMAGEDESLESPR